MTAFGLQDVATGETHPIVGDLIIGRETGFNDGRMSRRHFRVFDREGQIMVEDLGSSNGTFVNTNRLTPKESIIIQIGDAIEAGNKTFLLVPVESELVRKTIASKTSKWRQQSQKDSSPKGMISLLIVLIVGLVAAAGFLYAPPLTSLSLPFFHKRSAATLQVKAKEILEQLAKAEKDFHTQHGFFTGDLATLLPTASQTKNAFIYKFGFQRITTHSGEELARYSQPLNPEMKDSDRIGIPYAPHIVAFTFDQLAEMYCPDCVVNSTAFKAVAVGNLDDDEALDVWTIDNMGNLVHVSDDVVN